MPSKLPTSLAEIAFLHSPKARANALLKVKSADIYNPLYVALLYSVETPEAGKSARTLAKLRDDLLRNPIWMKYWSGITLVPTVPMSAAPAKEHIAKIEYFWSFTDYDTLARALLDFGQWTEVGFGEIVRRATFGRTPACGLLHAQALIRGVLQYVEPCPITITRLGERRYYRIEGGTLH